MGNSKEEDDRQIAELIENIKNAARDGKLSIIDTPDRELKRQYLADGYRRDNGRRKRALQELEMLGEIDKLPPR